MAEYIDRKALLDELCHDNCERTYDGTCHNCRMTDTIADFPAAEVAEVRHGRWIFEPGKIPYCSACKEYSDDGDKGATFCPWCGARMDKEDEHEAD